MDDEAPPPAEQIISQAQAAKVAELTAHDDYRGSAYVRSIALGEHRLLAVRLQRASWSSPREAWVTILLTADAREIDAS